MKSVKPSKKEMVTSPCFFSTDVAKAQRFYLDLNPPANRRLIVVCGGLEHCTSEYAIHRSSFPFYSIEYVARGHGSVKLGNTSSSLRPGRVFSYGPGISQKITVDPSDPLVKYFVDFSGTQAGTLLRSCGLLPGRVSEIFPATALQPLFDELIHAGLQIRRGSAELCAKLLECLALRISLSLAPIESAETRAFATYQRCLQHIDEFSLRLQTLEQIADECHVSSAYLCRLFQQFDHRSPYQYLLRLKMNFAVERLQQPGALVKQVASECGFSDPFHFSRVFRSVFGLSPAGIRVIR